MNVDVSIHTRNEEFVVHIFEVERSVVENKVCVDSSPKLIMIISDFFNLLFFFNKSVENILARLGKIVIVRKVKSFFLDDSFKHRHLLDLNRT